MHFDPSGQSRSRASSHGRRFLLWLAVAALACVLTMVVVAFGWRRESVAAGAAPVAHTDGAVGGAPATDDALPMREGRLVEMNLERLGRAAAQWFAEHPDGRTVTYDELQRWSRPRLELKPVADEAYAGLLIVRGWTHLAVELPDGRTVEFRRPADWPRE